MAKRALGVTGLLQQQASQAPIVISAPCAATPQKSLPSKGVARPAVRAASEQARRSEVGL